MGLFSVFGKVFGAGVKETAQAIGMLAKDIRQAITGELPPEKRAELEQKLLELESKALEMQSMINLEEAKSNRILVAGWRPFIGWICGFVLCWNYIIHPLLCWITVLAKLNVTPPPVLGLGELMPILLGMLGLGWYRTKEKIEGVHDRH